MRCLPRGECGLFELVLALAVVGQDFFYPAPKARAVVHFVQVGEFVHDDVVEQRQWHLYQPPLQAYAALACGAAPAGGGAAEFQAVPAHAELRCVVVEAFGK